MLELSNPKPDRHPVRARIDFADLGANLRLSIMPEGKEWQVVNVRCKTPEELWTALQYAYDGIQPKASCSNVPPTSSNRQPDIEFETVEDFLARGGQITVLKRAEYKPVPASGLKLGDLEIVI